MLVSLGKSDGDWLMGNLLLGEPFLNQENWEVEVANIRLQTLPIRGIVYIQKIHHLIDVI